MLIESKKVVEMMTAGTEAGVYHVNFHTLSVQLYF